MTRLLRRRVGQLCGRRVCQLCGTIVDPESLHYFLNDRLQLRLRKGCVAHLEPPEVEPRESEEPEEDEEREESDRGPGDSASDLE